MENMRWKFIRPQNSLWNMKSENLQWCCQSKSSRVVLDFVQKNWALDFADWLLLKGETTASQKLLQMGFCIETVQRASAKCSRFSCLIIVYYCYWMHLAFFQFGLYHWQKIKCIYVQAVMMSMTFWSVY